MKQLVHETDKLAISTVYLSAPITMLDTLLGVNPENLPYETMVFPLVNGEPDFAHPIETKRYASETEAKEGHQEMIRKYG